MPIAPKTPLWFLISRHWTSLAGVALIATAGLSVLFVAPQEVRGHASNPYIGIVLFLILPAVFLAGLALIPIGVYLSRREIRKGLAEATVNRKAALRRLALALGITTLANLLLGSQLTYRAVKHMETPQFCGATCHTMKPEFAAYQNSPHSRIECVDCHVAPGAAGWVDSKMNGMRQLIQTALGTVPKPIPSALESNRLVPARETCENCHWPEKFSGVRLRVFSKFADDEGNTRTETVLMMMIGGNRMSGIHGAHFGPGVHIRYAAADQARQSIPRVEYRNEATGETRSFSASDAKGTSTSALPTFEMQCVDCHNRPTHTFELPERAMDKALAAGDVPSTLPFIKKQAVQLLKAQYRTSEDASDRLPNALADFYRQHYPEVYSTRRRDVEKAGRSLIAIYQRNVFPDLAVTWGTYPNNLGHTDFPGCFRCHDGSHTTPDGKTITQDCSACHEALAIEETAPEILKTLGVAERMSKLGKQRD